MANDSECLCTETIIGIITQDRVIGNLPESLSGVLGSSPSPATHLRPEGKNKVFFVGNLFPLPTYQKKEESECYGLLIHPKIKPQRVDNQIE